MMLVWAALVGATFGASPVRSAEVETCPPSVPEAGEAVGIASARPGGVLLLADGRLVRRAGVEIRDGAAPERPGAAVLHARGPLDRHAILPADFEGERSALRLVGAGEARVRPRPGETICAPVLLAAEERARRAGLGLWADPGYAVRDASDEAAIGREVGRFVVLEGRVSHVGTSGTGASRGRVFIDFGPVWRTDVTIVLSGRDLPRFIEAGLDPQTLEGHRIRARGVVAERGGPALLITEPSAIERLDDTASRATP